MQREENTILEYSASNRRRRWRPLRARVLVCCIFIVCAATVALFWALVRVEISHSARCASHMRSIGQVLRWYSSEFDAGPASFAEVLEMIRRSAPRDGNPPGYREDREPRHGEVWVCPSSDLPIAVRRTVDSDYVLTLAAATRIDLLKPDTIVVYEFACRHNGKMNILLADGSVRSISAAESHAMLADLNAGKNPPPSLQSKVGR